MQHLGPRWGRGNCDAIKHAMRHGEYGVFGTPGPSRCLKYEGFGGLEGCALRQVFPELFGSLSGIHFAACIAGVLSCFGDGMLSVKSMLHWRN